MNKLLYCSYFLDFYSTPTEEPLCIVVVAAVGYEAVPWNAVHSLQPRLAMWAEHWMLTNSPWSGVLWLVTFPSRGT